MDHRKCKQLFIDIFIPMFPLQNRPSADIYTILHFSNKKRKAEAQIIGWYRKECQDNIFNFSSEEIEDLQTSILRIF